LLLKQIAWNQVKVAALDGDLLANPQNHSSKQWVLLPKTGNWAEIQKYVQGLLD